jgi:hypothetical protein
VNLELYKAGDIMKSPVCYIHSIESIAALDKLLVVITHGGYPVVKYDEETRTDLAYDLISRYGYG